MNVQQLRERLANFPGYLEVAVEITVGGDIVTDIVDLDDVRLAGHSVLYVELVPAPDEYDLRALIDDGLAARADAEEREAMNASLPNDANRAEHVTHQ